MTSCGLSLVAFVCIINVGVFRSRCLNTALVSDAVIHMHSFIKQCSAALGATVRTLPGVNVCEEVRCESQLHNTGVFALLTNILVGLFLNPVAARVCLYKTLVHRLQDAISVK